MRLEDIEHKASGPVASVELRPGQVIRIPAWMLDSSACAGMKNGSPSCISWPLWRTCTTFLVAQGFRRSFSGDRTVTEEIRDEAVADTWRGRQSEACQLSMPLDTPKLRGLSRVEREAVVGALAGLLLEATADPAEGGNDDACI